MTNNGNFLRQALLLDAGASGLMGIVMAAAPSFVGRLLNLPSGFVLGIGLFFVVFAATLLVLRRYPLPALIWLVILGNAAWGVASIAVLFTDLLAPNMLGVAVIVFQAVAVLVFAELEYLGQRRATLALA